MNRIYSQLLFFLFVFSLLLQSTKLVGQQPFQKVIDASQPKLVKVFGASAGRVSGYATGIVVSNDGLILTMQGVFLDGQQVRVVDHDGNEFLASVLRRDRTAQLALLKIQHKTPEFFELSDTPVGEKGDWVVAICNAFKVADKSEPISATLGVISLRTSIEAMLNRRDVAYRGKLVLIDAITSNPGAGGGAVVTLEGTLVGMVGKIINSSETNTRLNYAVPSESLLAFVNGKQVAQQRTAVKQVPVDLGIKLFKLGGRSGPAYVDRVVRQGPASKAGIKSDDLIISIAGEKIGSVKQYSEVLKTLVPGTSVVVVVKRKDELLQKQITPREAK